MVIQSQSHPSSEVAEGRFRVAYSVALAVIVSSLIVPLWLGPTLPLSDFANHVARAHVLAHRGEIAQFQTFYEPAWGPYPNLAFDLVAVPLARFVSADVAGRIFLTLTALVWCFGCVSLGRAVTGRLCLRALFACFLLYNESFLLGYANFSFGLGLAFVAVALFLRSRASPSPRLLAALGVVAVATVVSHAAAFVTMVVAISGISVAELYEARRQGWRLPMGSITKRALPLTGACAYFLVWLSFYADHTKDKGFASVGTSTKLLLSSMLPTYSSTLDLVVLGVVVVSGLAALLASRRWTIHVPMAAGAAMLTLAVYLAPADFGGGYEANGRYVVGAWVLALFAVSPRSAPARSRLALAPLALCIAVLIGRQGILGRAFVELGRDMDAQAQLFDALPEGTVLGNLTFLDGRASRAQRLRERAVLHATSLAVVSRDADVPTLYAIPGVQPIRHRVARYDVHRFRSTDRGPFEIDRIRRELDAALLCHAPDELRAGLIEGGTSLGSHAGCELVRWR